MRRYGFSTFLGLYFLIPTAVLLLGGRSLLAERVAAIEAFLSLGPTTVEFEDDFEDGLDPAWTQVNGTTQTIAPTADCGGAYWSLYSNCGSLGLHFDEVERYDLQLQVPTAGSLSLYFHDDVSDTVALAFAAIGGPGEERIGVATPVCPNHYYVAVNHGTHRCTLIPRRTGWHKVEFIRNGFTTKGYLDYVLVFETNAPGREVVDHFRVIQEDLPQLLNGFAIDDVRFEAME
jgi:hypothetical protein